jgi:predicted alpha/beta-fold hydrolase
MSDDQQNQDQQYALTAAAAAAAYAQKKARDEARRAIQTQQELRKLLAAETRRVQRTSLILLQMPLRKLAALSALFACTSLFAQQPTAITNDPEPNPSTPTQNLETVIDSHGSHIMGIFLLASGTQPHPTVILLHGFPGYEQNMDLAQSLRRDGWNVLAMHYRGSWGSQGTFSFTHCMEDVGTLFDYVTQPAHLQKFHVDPHHLVVIGHSLGGFMTVAYPAEVPARPFIYQNPRDPVITSSQIM